MAESSASNTNDSAGTGSQPADAGVQAAATTAAPQPSPSTPERGQPAPATADQQMRQILDRMMGKAGAGTSGSDPDAPASGRSAQPRAGDADGGDSGGKVQPAGTAQDGAAGKDAHAGSATEPALVTTARELLGTVSRLKGKLDSMSDAEVLESAREQARQALKLWQWDDETLAQVPDSILFKKGLAARQAQVKQDRELSEIARFRQLYQQMLTEDGAQGAPAPSGKAQAALGTPGTPGTPGAQRPEAGAAAKDATSAGTAAAAAIDQTVEQILAPFKDDQFHGDLYPALTQALGAVSSQAKAQIESLQRGHQALQEQFEDKLNQAYLKIDQLMLDFTASQMAQQIPALADKSKRAEVFAKARQLGNLPQYRDAEGNLNWEELVHDAYHIRFAKEIEQDRQKQLTRRYREQTGGQPKGAAMPAPSARQPMTADEQLRARLDALRGGKTPDEVVAEFAGA